MYLQDKKDNPLWLGVGPDGICECPKHDKNEQMNVSRTTMCHTYSLVMVM